MSPITSVLSTRPEAPQATPAPSLETRLQVALEHARRMSAMFEAGNIEVAIAWETVEELAAARSHQKAAAKSAFSLYCEANPDAPECRLYED